MTVLFLVLFFVFVFLLIISGKIQLHLEEFFFFSEIKLTSFGARKQTCSLWATCVFGEIDVCVCRGGGGGKCEMVCGGCVWGAYCVRLSFRSSVQPFPLFTAIKTSYHHLFLVDLFYPHTNIHFSFPSLKSTSCTNNCILL